MILGNRRSESALVQQLQANGYLYTWASELFGDPLDAPLVIGSVAALLDGLAVLGTGATATITAEVAGATSRPVEVAPGMEQQWVHFVFDDPPTLPASTELVVTLAALGGDVARLFVREEADAGVVSGVGPDEVLDRLPSLVVAAIAPWQAPATLTLEQRARLPLYVASAALDSGAASAPFEIAVGWFYTPEDPPPNAGAVARVGSALADLVGNRVRVRADDGTALVVYVYDEDEFEDRATEDLQLSRNAFERLAPLNADTVIVTAEVLG